MPWPEPLLAVYASAELILALQISLSNFVVILVYLRSKHIRTPTNAYIFSLAMTDFLAGALGIPFTVASVLTRWPGSYYACLAIHLILCVLCTVSTLHLLAMAVDKYLTICLKRFDHQRTSSSSSARKSRANFLIVSAWISGAAIAGLPMIDGFGFASRTIGNFRGQCHFTVVVDYRYLVFVIFFGTIILPSVVIAYCYMSIYSHIRNEERQIKCLLRASERQRRINARRKLIRILLILVLTYACCWYPLYLINTVDLFLPARFHAGPYMTLAAVVLSHLNCALNPVIYAYGVPGFKHSLRRFLPLKLATHCAQQQRGVLPYTGTSSHQQHCGPLFPPLKSPFLGSNGLAMGAKRTGMLVVQQQQQQPSSAATRQHQVNYRRMAPVGKFSRAISTMDAIPPTHCGARMPLAGKQSSQSLLETRRQQFRQRNDRSQQQQQHLDEQRRRRSTTVETETDDHSAGEEALSSGEQATAATEHSSGCEHGGGGIGTTGGGKLSHSSADSSCLSASGDVPTTEKVPMPKQQRPQSASVASRVSWLSLLIFNGHWLMKRRKTSSREEATGGGAQQRWSLADGDGIGLVEGRLMGEEESG